MPGLQPCTCLTSEKKIYRVYEINCLNFFLKMSVYERLMALAAVLLACACATIRITCVSLPPPLCALCHLFTASVFMLYHDSGIRRREAVGCVGRVSETQAFIKQPEQISCGVPQSIRPLLSVFFKSALYSCALSCNSLVAALGALAYCGRMVSTY